MKKPLRSVVFCLVSAIALSCGPSSKKDCEEYCRYSTDVGACVDRCRGDAGGDHDDVCDPDLETCPPTVDDE